MRWPWSARPDPAEDPRWIVIDVETSGLDPARSHLLAIAGVALRLDGAAAPRVEIADSFEVCLRPPTEAPLPDKANILVHGLGIERQRAGSPPAAALAAFIVWAGDAPRLGYHVGFDRAVIERAQRLHATPSSPAPTPARWLDLAPLAEVLHPQVAAKALDDWLDHFEITCLARHEAVADALATAELLLRLWPALRRERAITYAACAKLAASGRWAGR